MRPVAWTIAGADSSGGAGAAADLKVLEALGVHGASVLTAVTAQGLETFHASVPVSGAMIRAQIQALANVPRPAAVKVGMLPTVEAVEEVAAFLADLKAPVILDPVASASSGGRLTEDAALAALRRSLLHRVDLLTPNVPEAERLLGEKITTAADVEDAATRLLALGARRVLVKGGHLSGLAASDHFRSSSGESFWIHGRKSEDVQVRGTGCALSSAVAAGLALGLTVEDAVVLGKGYVTRGIRESYGPDGGPRFLAHGAWPVEATDMPWITPTAAAGRHSFPGIDGGDLGFYPVVPTAAWVERLVGAGARTIQLRLKDAPHRRDEIASAVAAASKTGARLFINDHWAEAIEAKAYGVHLGQEDLVTADLAAIAAAGLRLGISTHSLKEAAVAHAHGPSYVALGPIFATTCKAMRFGPQGLPRVAEWRSLFETPLVAIGGLKLAHVQAARELGANGVAVISDVLENPNPEARAREWLTAAGQGDA